MSDRMDLVMEAEDVAEETEFGDLESVECGNCGCVTDVLIDLRTDRPWDGDADCRECGGELR